MSQIFSAFRWTRLIPWRLGLSPLLVVALGWNTMADLFSQPKEQAQLLDGKRVAGRLVGTQVGPAFQSDEAPFELIAWPELRQIELETTDPAARIELTRPFIVKLADGSRVSARTVRLVGTGIEIDTGLDESPWTIPRPWIRSISQRVGEAVLLSQWSDTKAASGWKPSGSVEVVETPRSGLRLGQSGAGLRYRPSTGLASGRLELGFEQEGTNFQWPWWVDLKFRVSGGDDATIRIRLGSKDPTVLVESQSGISLAVQRLVREPGRHRLVARWSQDRTDLSLDGNELAHGEGIPGELVEVAVGTGQVDSKDGPMQSVLLDGVQLVRRLEKTARPEVDLGIDSLVRINGDQLFGAVQSLGSEGVGFATGLGVDPIRLPWRDLSAVSFKRDPFQPTSFSGPLVHVSWNGSPGDPLESPDELEAMLLSVDERWIQLFSPALGKIQLPKNVIRRLEPQGVFNRLVLDPWPYHLGNRFDPELDPPLPDGATLEHRFELNTIPSGAVSLVLDVLGVVGVDGTPAHSERVKAGHLRTVVELNDRRIGDLNDLITTLNTSRQRVRMGLPPGLLQRGLNTIRFSQIGTPDDPDVRENLSILSMSLEWSAGSKRIEAGNP